MCGLKSVLEAIFERLHLATHFLIRFLKKLLCAKPDHKLQIGSSFISIWLEEHFRRQLGNFMIPTKHSLLERMLLKGLNKYVPFLKRIVSRQRNTIILERRWISHPRSSTTFFICLPLRLHLESWIVALYYSIRWSIG